MSLKPMAHPLVENAYAEFAEHAYPNVAKDSVQWREMRTVWFSAFHICFELLSATSATLTEDKAMEALALLRKELDAFASEMKQRKINRN